MANQARSRRAHAPQVLVDSAIALLYREPRVAAGFALLSRSRERYVRTEQLKDVARIADALAAEVPAGRGSQRHCYFGIVNARDVVAVRIDLRNVVRQRHHLPADPPPGANDAPRIGYAGQRRELHVLNANERCVVNAGIAARRRRRAVCHPLMQRSQQCPHYVVLRSRIAELLTCHVPHGNGGAFGGRLRGGGNGPVPAAFLPAGTAARYPVTRGRASRRRSCASAPQPVHPSNTRPAYWCRRPSATAPRVSRQQPVARPIRVRLDGIGKWKLRRLERVAMARCGETFVEGAARSAGNVRPYGVEDAPAVLVGIEAIVEELPGETTRLRNTE